MQVRDIAGKTLLTSGVPFLLIIKNAGRERKPDSPCDFHEEGGGQMLRPPLLYPPFQESLLPSVTFDLCCTQLRARKCP